MPSKPNVEIIKHKPRPRSRQKPAPKQQQLQVLPPLETKFLLRSVSRMETEINRLWIANKFIDIVLVCDGQQFNCHRLVVAAASRLIERLLLENTSNNPTVIIPFGVRPPILKLLIDFMYTGSAFVTEYGLQELVESAKLLQVTGLYDVTTRCLECFVDVSGGNCMVESKHTVLENVSKIEQRIFIQNYVGQSGYPKQIEAANQQNDDMKMVDVNEIREYDSDVVPFNQEPATSRINESSARIPNYDKISKTTPIPHSNTKLFCEYNAINEVTDISENVTIRRVPKSQPERTRLQPTSKLFAMFGQCQLSQQLKSLRPVTPTNTVLSNRITSSTQFVSTGAPIVASGMQPAPARNQHLSNILKITENSFRVPIGRSPKVSNTISKTTPSRVSMSSCRNTPATIARHRSTSSQIRAISQQMLKLRPRIRLSRLRSNSPMEMPTLTKQAKRAETEEPKCAGDLAHSSFLNLRVPPSASVLSSETTPHTEAYKSLVEQEASVFQGHAVSSTELGKSSNGQEELYGIPHLSMDTDVVKSDRTSPVEECEIDGFSPADASFIRHSFPEFYAMLKKEKQDRIAAEKEREKKLGQQLLNEDEARAVVTMLSNDEIEKILCHPTLPFFDDDDVEDYEQEESKIIDTENGICIDYDRLVAETYSEDEEEPQQREKRQESNLDEKTSFYYPPKNIPYSLPKFRKCKYPPTLLPLSVMHAKQFYYNHKLNTEENGDINFKEDPSIFGDADPEVREGDPRAPNSVVLRNPRCNQPRNYSTESLYNALMAVKYGESIYRASRLHAVPRKTLRNWMKRFNIKSKHPMPKQLQDAANNNRKKDPKLLSRAAIAVAKSKRITRNPTKRPARSRTVTSTTATLSISDDSGFKGFPDDDCTSDS